MFSVWRSNLTGGYYSSRAVRELPLPHHPLELLLLLLLLHVPSAEIVVLTVC
jgi:hypothetical protein